jgi:hypothetical protein
MKKRAPVIFLVILPLFMFVFPAISGANLSQNSTEGGKSATPSFSSRDTGPQHPAETGRQINQVESGKITSQNLRATSIAITQSSDTSTIISGNSVSCNNNRLHAANSYFRRFDLDGVHNLKNEFSIKSVDIGIELAQGNTGSQPLEVRLYALANGNALTLANLHLIGSASFSQPDANLIVQNFPVSGTINPLTDDLVVELFTPDGIALNNSFFIGSNTNGQSAPSYIVAPDCGVNEITSMANIGFPNVDIVMVVNIQPGFPWPMFMPAVEKSK